MNGLFLQNIASPITDIFAPVIIGTILLALFSIILYYKLTTRVKNLEKRVSKLEEMIGKIKTF